jgi:hypothetical protein
VACGAAEAAESLKERVIPAKAGISIPFADDVQERWKKKERFQLPLE